MSASWKGRWRRKGTNEYTEIFIIYKMEMKCSDYYSFRKEDKEENPLYPYS